MMVMLTACGGGSSDAKQPVDPTVPADPQQVAINKIAAYAENAKTAPVLKDYENAGVTGVTEENIDAINQAIEALDRKDADTQKEIQAIADEYGVVIPPDVTPPVITLLGDNPVTMTVNEIYSDAGATAVDDRDGNIAVVTTGSVDTSAIGTYLLQYTAADSAGNSAAETRTVHVLPPDTTSPLITINGDNPVTVFQGYVYDDTGATATDDRDESVTVQATGSVDTSAIGTYVIAYDAVDSAGNHAQTQIRSVNVVQAPDITPPVITILGDNPENVDLNGTYVDAGATAMDDRDGDVAVTATGSVNTSTLGTYVIAYTAADSAGNSATETRTVHVRLPDITPPVITIVGDNPATVDVNDTYVDAGATAWDERDGEVMVEVTGSVDTSTIGIYTITYTATDKAENNTTLTRTVNVIEPVNYAPIANAGADIITRQGSDFVLDGSLSSDDEAVVRHEWFSGGTKLGEGATLELNATELGAGKYMVTLVVTDTEDLQDSDTIRVNVLYGIKKTGQTKSYNEDGVEIDDNSLKDNGYYQKGVDTVYSRDDVNGTVIDHISGLMWQDNGLVNRVWLTIENYHICENDTSSDACFDTSGETAVAYCEDMNLSGYENWRLPNVKEMQRIVDYAHRTPAIDTIFKYSTVGYYWTVSSVVYYEDYAWVVNFEYGDANAYLKGANLSLRCVRDRVSE